MVLNSVGLCGMTIADTTGYLSRRSVCGVDDNFVCIGVVVFYNVSTSDYS